MNIKNVSHGLVSIGLVFSTIGIVLFMIVGNRTWGYVFLFLGFALCLMGVILILRKNNYL